jgi:hypothetical protein
MPFWLSICLLGLLQAALVAVPRPRQRFGWMPESLWWALVPAGSIVVVVGAIELDPDAAELLTWLALLTVPPLAAFALGDLLRCSRPWWALLALPLFAVAWAASGGSLAAETAATALTALGCVTLGWLLVCVVPGRWLRAGVYAMAALDAALIVADLLQGPNSVLSAAAPAADLPRLQAVHFGSARMGFGDLFVAALVGCMLAGDRRSQLQGAALVAVLALSFDLLFFAVDSLPGTVPVAVALAIVQWTRRGDGGREAEGPGSAQL